jgi:hypothetical protein
MRFVQLHGADAEDILRTHRQSRRDFGIIRAPLEFLGNFIRDSLHAAFLPVALPHDKRMPP